jgi:nitrite reductase/ring-hydroxylating ferredoxin subunit
MAQKHYVCPSDELRQGQPHIVAIRGFTVGVYRLADSFHALLNVCPHRGAPLCEGPQCGTTAPVGNQDFVYHREGEIVRCAWHGWEFDIKTGASLVEPSVRARTFPVMVEDGKIYVIA